MKSGNPAGWRNLTRHEEGFDEVLYRQLRRTPWWLVSAAFHAVIVLTLFSLDFGHPAEAETPAIIANVAEDPIRPLDEIRPEIEPTTPIEQPDEPVENPVTDEKLPVEETETDNEQPFQENLGDVGEGDAPFEGFSKNAAIGIGGGGGAWPGRGGARNMKGSGSFREGERAVDLGLRWLRNHQDPNGMWDADGFSSRCKLNVCDGAGGALYDPGVTGLSLLAFLGAGHTHKHGEYRDHVARGLRYLKQVQDPEGCFGPRTAKNYTYNHAIASMAMIEAYGMTGSPLMRQSAQRSIDFIGKCQNPYLAWRYGVRPQDNDTSVSGWMIMALKSAKTAGLAVDQSCFDGMAVWIDKVTEPEYGRVGYTARGTGPARTPDQMEKFPADKSEALTAVGILSRIFLGENPAKSEMIRKGTDLCLRNLPVWDPQSGAIDMYYWYYGTLALFQVGGEPFKQWNEAIRTAVIDHQRTSGDEAGSWDPVGPWGREGGRVYSTALLTMCMEVYYRYPRVPYTR